ncbi:hypothetical protein LTR17_000068 [Elasticomyces elasticus]|nr:hypothetical protein LTR17_000068 [Elasticomyces elasticus]
MGKPRTPGPASKKRKADDARHAEGEEASNKTIPGTTAGKRFTKAELATIPTRPRAQRDTHDTQIPFGTAIRRSDTRMPEDAVFTPEDHAYAASEASLHRQPAIKQEANQDTVLHDVPLHSDDSGYGAPDSDAKVDVKSVSAAHATSTDQLTPTAGSSSLHKTPVQADMKYELAGIDEALTPPVFHAGSLLDGCLDVLRYVPCNTKFYAQALEKVLKHAADSPKDIPSVLGGLRDYLPQDRYQPIAQELIGNDLQHQALMLVVNIDTPLMLRQVLSTIFHGVQQEFLSEVPDILAHVPGAPSLPTSSVSTSAHTPYTPQHEDLATPGQPAKRRKTEFTSSPPVAATQYTPGATQHVTALESTTTKPKLPRRRQTKHCNANADSTPQACNANTAPPACGGAHRPEVVATVDVALAPTFIPFAPTNKQNDRVLYTVDCPAFISTGVTGLKLRTACQNAFGQHSITSVNRLNPHVWCVIFKSTQTASRALSSSIVLQNTELIPERASQAPAKVFTWQSVGKSISIKAVARRLRAVWAARYPNMVVRYRRSKGMEGAPGTCNFVVQFPYAPRLLSFFLPIRVKDDTITAWFQPVSFHSPCPLCDSTEHTAGSLCAAGKLAKVTSDV